MTIGSGPFRACCARMWRCVLLTGLAMAGWDLTGQLTGWVSPQDPGVPAGWADRTPVTDEPRAIVTAVTPHAAPGQARGFMPAELARLGVLRAGYYASRAPFTPRELERLHCVRWLHHTGRVTR